MEPDALGRQVQGAGTHDKARDANVKDSMAVGKQGDIDSNCRSNARSDAGWGDVPSARAVQTASTELLVAGAGGVDVGGLMFGRSF